MKRTTSSPHHPQGNSEAESGVRIAKRTLKQNDPFLALINYRMAKPHVMPVKVAYEKTKIQYNKSFDRRHDAKVLPHFDVGDNVKVKLDSE